MDIRRAVLDDSSVRALIEFHHRDMHANSPAGLAFAFDVENLKSSGIHVLATHDGVNLVGVRAVSISGTQAELKSMRVSPACARIGVGTALLAALTDLARVSGAEALYLETGSGPAFESAGRFYEKHGFVPCGPFGDYIESGFNRFMRKAL